jgi:hypothetical protein
VTIFRQCVLAGGCKHFARRYPVVTQEGQLFTSQTRGDFRNAHLRT